MDIEQETQKVIERIKAERLNQKMSQMEMALESGVSQGFIAMIESGRKIPTISTILKIARALKIKPSILFEEKNQSREESKEKIIKLIKNEL